MPLQETSGNLTTDAYGGGGAAVVANYIEDVFSTYLYTGTGASQTITNGIDLSTKGGLTWIKSRSAATDHKLTDTARGVTKALISDTTGAQTTDTTGLTAFGTTGFTIGADANYNTSAATYVSWTFRKQPKFFDVVTYSGNSTTGRQIAHSLGSAPGCIIIKNTTIAGTAWAVWHRSLATGYNVQLQGTNAAFNTKGLVWFNNSTQGNSSTFEVGYDTDTNETGSNYVAYVFAHNAGGFGLTGADNVISCGSATMDGSGGATVNLGYETQWVMIKRTDSSGSWYIEDIMRGLSVGSQTSLLAPNLSNAELNDGNIYNSPTSTGFRFNTGQFAASATYIYIAIRRGPMAVPTDATKVFAPIIYTGNATASTARTTGILTDMVWSQSRQGNAYSVDYDRLRGAANRLSQPITNAEVAETGTVIGVSGFDTMNGYIAGQDQGSGGINFSSWTYANWNFRRAPNFFDQVCYTGTGSATTFNHNLGIAPELIIAKKRSAASTTGWLVGATTLGYANKLYLNLTNASAADSTAWNSTAPTSTVFSVGTNTDSNASAATFVAYLFATCAGVSKVGSYTGNGTTQTINCGFGAGGARFVLLKRTDAVGNWYVYDTARGMTTLTDPYLLLNSVVAETATLGSVTTVSTGFALNSTILAAINVSAGTYIFLAIA
jgi:hypothetical protein